MINVPNIQDFIKDPIHIKPDKTLEVLIFMRQNVIHKGKYLYARFHKDFLMTATPRRDYFKLFLGDRFSQYQDRYVVWFCTVSLAFAYIG